MAHVHDATTDAIRVLDGTLTVQIGDETTQAGPGAFVLIPPGVPHTFSNPGSEPVRLLNILAPGGFEGYFHEVAAAGRTIDAAEGSQIASKYDFRAI